MGQILSNPYIEKEHHEGSDKYTFFGFCAMQGWRVSMEDAHVVELNVNGTMDGDEQKDHVAFYSVFDGHGGSKVAEFCGKNSIDILRNLNSFRNGDYMKSMLDFSLEVDNQLLESDINANNDHSGCTFTGVLISRNQNLILCANSGDSRTVLATNGYAKALSFDHKPSIMGERSRINNAGGFVEMDRVNGNLALSRAMGDFEFKSNLNLSPFEQAVTTVPDIIKRNINLLCDDFIILACDGIWDCLSSQDCVELVYYGIYFTDLNLNGIASRIIDVCCAPNTEGTGIGCDNMSITIVALLDSNESEDEWFTRIRSKKYVDNISTPLLSFEARRKTIYDYFTFDESLDHTVFDITTRSPDSSNHNTTGNNIERVGPGEISQNSDRLMEDSESIESRNNKRSVLKSDPISEENNISPPLTLYTLNNLLSSHGIQISRGDSNNSGTAYIQNSNLPEILAAFGNTPANEVTNLVENDHLGDDMFVDDQDEDHDIDTPETRNVPDSAFD